jgi:DNA-binding MarR family transcriptional regulator
MWSWSWLAGEPPIMRSIASPSTGRKAQATWPSNLPICYGASVTESGSQDTAVAAQRLSVAITRLRSRLREEAGLDGTGLSVSQMSVLWHILQAGPVTAAELATAQHVSPQSIAQNLAVLKAAGLVQTERDPGDGRKTLITASESTRQLVTSVRASKESYLARAIDALVGPEQRADLDRAIELLERLAVADLSQHAGSGKHGRHGRPRENA